MPHILLLRDLTPSNTDSDPDADPYESALAAAGYTPRSLAPLVTLPEPAGVLRLLDILRGGPGGGDEEGWGGVIVTSKRACEAWREALRLLRESASSSGTGNTDDDDAAVHAWARVPFYVVGEATGAALSAAFEEHITTLSSSSSSSTARPALDIRGQSTGTASALAPFIIHDTRSPSRPHPTASAPLLYLTGDKNRDVLSRALAEGGVEVREVRVYATSGDAGFGERVGRVLRERREETEGGSISESRPDPEPWWIVYFAPSAAAHATPFLRAHFQLQPASPTSTPTPILPPANTAPTASASANSNSNSNAPTTPRIPAKIAAIGPTTRAFLQDSPGLAVHATAGTPTPEGVVRAVRGYDDSGGRWV